MMGFYDYGPMMGGGWGIGMALIGIVFWVLVIIAVVSLVRYAVLGGFHGRQRWHETSENDSAIQILKERYAKGEIDKNEFESKMKDLAVK